jgi:hypothetical protein
MKVQELLDKHKLSMSDIEFAEYAQDEIDSESTNIFQETLGKRNVSGRSVVTWAAALANVIAEHMGCTMYTWTGSSRFTIIGTKTDREAALYTISAVMNILFQGAKDAAHEIYLEHGSVERGFRRSWLLGAVTGVRTQLRNQRRATVAADTTGNALIRLTNQVALAWKDENVSGLRKASSAPAKSYSAYADGRKFGENVNIPGGVGAGKSSRRLNSGN